MSWRTRPLRQCPRFSSSERTAQSSLTVQGADGAHEPRSSLCTVGRGHGRHQTSRPGKRHYVSVSVVAQRRSTPPPPAEWGRRDLACILPVVVQAQECGPGGCRRVVATAHRLSGQARSCSSHGRSVVRRGDRIARTGQSHRRDRFPSALGAGVHGARDRCDHALRSGHHPVPAMG
jgi:hypothetical protein